MLYIYSNNTTTRLEYTLEVLFRFVLDIPFKLIGKEDFIALKSHAKINYSNEKLPDALWIKPHVLLFETEIKPQNIAVTHHEGIPFFFKTNELEEFNYDLFASSFYMLSRYEEYLNFEPDSHGRFPANQSLGYKANFLQIPVVNLWANLLKEAVLQQNPNFKFPKKQFLIHNTLDIDFAYKYKGKAFVIRLGGLLRSFISLNFSDLKKRIKTCFGAKDPFDVYAVLKKIQEEKKVKTTYFFQVGKYGKYDKNTPLKKIKNLILQVGKHAEIGIHPSYQSNTDFKILRQEIKSLSDVIGKTITKSRQHYLKLSLPGTYENLIKLGVKNDYTMGFASALGFRAGIANSFPFFNLKSNTTRPLLLHPFQIMDVTLKDYLKLSANEALNEIEKIKATVKAVDGEFISLFHNSSLTDSGEWKAWLEVYKSTLS